MLRYATLIRFAVALVATAILVRSASGDDVRYTAVFSDGNRVPHARLTDWGNNNNQPKLDGKLLFDQSNPIRWLKKETAEQPNQPMAFVEMFGGDCLPGHVTNSGSTSTVEEGELPEHLIVEPTIPLSWPERTQPARTRVMTRWLRRIVWERRSVDQYEPATLFFRDGRQLSFRSIRFGNASVSVLTDAERREIPFSDLAELDMPRVDWWDAYFEQVALLTPDCKTRLTRLETLDGLKVTTSADRFQPMAWPDPNNPECWLHAVQPAWSLDPLWVRHSRVVMRRFFGPHEVPLSLIEPSDTKLRSALAVGWRPQVDRNVQGGPLQSGDKEAGWGLGMHAYTEMHFPLPACVQTFRSRVGLDRVVGKGGCARAVVYLNKAEGEPLFRSDHLIGSDQTTDTGALPLNGSHGAELILVAHPDHADRPEGADPFDIRDVVDWLEPQVNLDLGALRTEVRSRLMRLMPGWQDWKVVGGEREKMVWLNRLDNVNPQYKDFHFHLEFKPQDASLTMTRKLTLETDQNWLLFYASRNPDDKQTSPMQMIVRIDGRQVGDFEVPARYGLPIPIAVPVDGFHGRPITIEARFVTRGDRSYVDWRSMAIVDKLPSLVEVFEDAPQPPFELKSSDGQNSIVTFDRYSGDACIKVTGEKTQVSLTNLHLPIRENPRFGEYKYICFALRKKGGQQIAMDLEFTQGASLGPQREDREKLATRLHTKHAQLAAVEKLIEQKNGQTNPPDRLQTLERREEMLKGEIHDLDVELTGGAADGAPGGITTIHRYFAGAAPAAAAEIGATRLAEHVPDQWMPFAQNLYQDSGGGGELTGITLSCPDGEYALFDHIYLARTEEDLKRCPQQAPAISVGR